MSRKSARENLFKLVYEFVSIEERNPLSFDLFVQEMAENDRAYLEEMYFGVTEKYIHLTSLIDKYAVDFSASRIFKVDLSIMLIATYEILYRNDIPFEVSINEALELSKIYSTEKSTSFINGVLSKIIGVKETL